MIEIPEAFVLVRQLNDTIYGKVIQRAVAAQTPHKLAWFYGDPDVYSEVLPGKTIGHAASRGGMVEVSAGDLMLVFSEGVNLRFHGSPAEYPLKHQLLIEFKDSTSFSGSIAMYGGLSCFKPGTFDNPYYQVAGEKPSPLSDGFDFDYFSRLFLPDLEKTSLKAFLATQQRIPGFGNGVLQDILYRSGLHPKRKVNSLDAKDRQALFEIIKNTLIEMAEAGGRDTERDLFGESGGYITQMSKNTAGKPCLVCGSLIQKQAYLGGSIYFCPGCQKE